VISTEDSGGGLPSFGVFSNQPIYTVYLDMRQTENDSCPSWTLEFAVISEPDKSANAADQSRSLQGLVLPFPALKERPVLPAELVRQHLGKMVIVYGVVNTGGEIEQLSVKESPDALLDQPVLDALSRWKFRAAQLNGDPVSVKLLLGIPLWLPQ
jgi:TonB family protein